MPIAPPRNCDYPGGCLGYAYRGSAYCEKHQPNDLENDRARDAQRYKNNPWRNWYNCKPWKSLCKWKLNENPICEKCQREGSYVVHHLIDHRGNWQLFIDRNNLQALCKKCHDEIAKPNRGKLPRLAPIGTSGAPLFTSALNDKAVDQALADVGFLGDVDEIKIPG